jgi:hypothetical protein
VTCAFAPRLGRVEMAVAGGSRAAEPDDDQRPGHLRGLTIQVRDGLADLGRGEGVNVQVSVLLRALNSLWFSVVDGGLRSLVWWPGLGYYGGYEVFRWWWPHRGGAGCS